MRWQGPVRALVALAGVGCVVALVVYSRKRPPPAVAPPVISNAKVVSEQHAVVNFRSNLSTQKEDLKVEAELQTEFDDGRIHLQHVHYTTTRKNGTVFDIWADHAESQGKAVKGDEPGLIKLDGHVRTKASDGLEVQTDSATYDNIQGLATIPGKLTFSRGRLKGEGVGATYDRERDILWLLDQAKVNRGPDEKGQGALEATAKGIGVARIEKYMNMSEHARVVQPDQALAADSMIVHFSDDDKGAKLIEMHGSAHVTPGKSAKKDAPDMQADEIMLEFQPDGQTLRHATLGGKARMSQTTDQGRQNITAETIDLTTGSNGRTLTNLQAQNGVEVLLPASDENPDRTIRATTLVTSGDENAGLTSAAFEGGITFIEKQPAGGPPGRGGGRGAAAVDRQAKSASLTLALKGGLGAIDSAEFRQNVRFTDGDMQATADLAVHDENLGTLVLTPTKGAKSGPRVQDPSVRVDAMWIQVTLATHDLRARDDVHTMMTQGKTSNGETHTPALFDGTQPVYGTGGALKYVSASKEATFAGDKLKPARVYQDDGNKISATLIVVEQDNGNMTATGDVVSNFLLDTPPDQASAKPKPATPAPAAGRGASDKDKDATAPKKTPRTVVRNVQQMRYSDADRQVTYVADKGKVVNLKGTDGDVDANQIVLSIAKDQRILKTLEASGTMYAKFDGGRETMGDRLVYDASTETHVITGKPLYFKNVQTDSGKPSCTLETSTELHYEGKDQTIDEPASAPKSLRPSTQLIGGCEKPLKTAVAELKKK